MLTQDEMERERYESRRKKTLDEASVRYEYQHGIERALEKGRVEGRVEGQVEGQVEGLIRQIHFAQRLLRQPLTPTEQFQAQSQDELKRLVDQPEQQSLAP